VASLGKVAHRLFVPPEDQPRFDEAYLQDLRAGHVLHIFDKIRDDKQPSRLAIAVHSDIQTNDMVNRHFGSDLIAFAESVLCDNIKTLLPSRKELALHVIRHPNFPDTRARVGCAFSSTQLPAITDTISFSFTCPISLASRNRPLPSLGDLAT
jgi:hypothetical protein